MKSAGLACSRALADNEQILRPTDLDLFDQPSFKSTLYGRDRGGRLITGV
jgi:hypothetical protein